MSDHFGNATNMQSDMNYRRELGDWLAEHVLGWHEDYHSPIDGWKSWWTPDGLEVEEDIISPAVVHTYLIPKMLALGYEYDFGGNVNGLDAMFTSPTKEEYCVYRSDGDIILAICEAARKAVESDG